MPTARGTIFSDAFEAIGIAEYVFSVTAEEQASAARKLDAMMATAPWNQLGYVATAGEPQPDVEMATDPQFDSAISYNLALALAPSFGKQAHPFVKGAAKKGLADVYASLPAPPSLPASRVAVTGGGDLWRRWNLP